MQNKPNNVWTVSDEQASTMIVLDENALEDVNGGCPLHIGAELVPEKMRLK